MSVNPSADNFATQGFNHYQDGDYDLAIIAYTQAIELVSNETEYYFYRGYSYLYLSDSQENEGGAGSRNNNRRAALEDFNAATEIDPDDPDFYIARAKFYLDSGFLDDAIEEYSNAIELDANDSSYYKSRGWIYSEYLHEYESAIEDFNLAIELDPDDPEAYSHRGLAYAELEEFNKSDSDFNRAAQLRSQV